MMTTAPSPLLDLWRAITQAGGIPAWVEVNADKAEGTFKKVPDRDEFAADVKEALIVELYSR